MNIDAQAILEPSSTPLRVDLALCLAALAYARGWLRLRSAFPNLISRWRLAAFFAGIIFVWVAIGSRLSAFDEASLTVHMVQHLLLMSIAPPLILLGAPLLPLLHGLPQSLARSVVGPILGWSPVKRLGRLVASPAFCWLAATFALIGWHVPAVFELALRWNWLHKLEHACFLGSGLLFWWPVIRPWPSAARWPRWSVPLYLFCATLPCDGLSAFLVFCDRVVYSSYLSSPRLFDMSPLEDQECAAALMWVCTTLIFLVPAVLVTLEILSPNRAHLREKA
jgi:putative membrane protein